MGPESLKTNALGNFLDAVHTQEPVEGLTHNFYRYPARFSPQFAHAAIEAFCEPGDTVLDPFMGGATTLVEARALGRHSVGCDISSLAAFIAKVKTTIVREKGLQEIRDWVESLEGELNLHQPAKNAELPDNEHYRRNLPWPMRKIMGLILAKVPELRTKPLQGFARCLLLKVSQWALDCRAKVPSATEFRRKLSWYLEGQLKGAREFRRSVQRNSLGGVSRPKVLCLHCSAAELQSEQLARISKRPSLVVTSPPYPGVYVLYHRWKVRGRKESAVPFWLADCNDGQGQAYYCFGDRRHTDLRGFFDGITNSFAGVRRVVAPDALVVQLVAFKEPDWQLPEYVEAMRAAGFTEVFPASLGIAHKGRLWRKVPGRRWFALIQGDLATSQEVVLFHRPRLFNNSSLGIDWG